jgi:hypothetical protein
LRLICRFRLTPTQYQKRVGLSWKMLWYSRQQLTRMRTSLSCSFRPRRFVRGEPRAEVDGVPCAGVPWACDVWVSAGAFSLFSCEVDCRGRCEEL